MHYTSELHKVSRTQGLDQSCELGVQCSQSVLQHLAMAGILSLLHLLENMASRQQDCIFFLFRVYLLGCKSLFRFGQSAGGCLLVLNRLAFPPTSNPQIIRRILGVHWLPISRHSRALKIVVLAALAAVTPVSTIKCFAWKAVWGYCSACIFA
jgi:hypothetical protein